MYSKNDNKEIIINDKVDEIINTFLNHYLIDLKITSIKFTHCERICYKCHKINPNRGGLFIDFPNWNKKKK